MRASFPTILITLGLALLPAQGNAEQKVWSTLGTLECTMGPSIGLVAGSRQQARCVFRSLKTNAAETYVGRMERPGLDVVLTGGKLVWVVLAPMEHLPPKWLAGRYSETREDVTVGFAGGAAVSLCRYAQVTACLEPLAGEDHEDGDNLAFGISAVRLE